MKNVKDDICVIQHKYHNQFTCLFELLRSNRYTWYDSSYDWFEDI
jgi:hypothetical protein